MPELTRLPKALVSDAMFIRPKRPDDHAEFEWLLPQCTPLFIYADENGRDWVRWSIPRPLADQLGWSKGCACCGNMEELSAAGEHSFVADTAWNETAWFLEPAT